MHPSNLLISIVIPSYNQGDYIARTIKSILDQDYHNFEIILIDGASTDDTLNILNQFKNKIKIIISEKDTGQSNAINKGFKLSKGDIVGWINSDDTFTSGAFSKIINEFEKDSHLEFVYGDINVIDQSDNIIGCLNGDTLNFPDFTWKLDLQVPQQGSFWRRNALEEKNIKLNESFHYVLDRDIFLRSLIELKSMYINSILGNFRHQNESKSISQSKKWIEEMPILYHQLIEDYKSNIFTKSTINNIKAMVDLYMSIEFVKLKKFNKSFKYLLNAILTKPNIFFISGLLKKITKYF